jgi:hypothetical protein
MPMNDDRTGRQRSAENEGRLEKILLLSGRIRHYNMTMTTMMRVFILAAVGLAGSVSGFSVLPANRLQARSSCLRMSEPSDTSSDAIYESYADDAVEVDSEPYEPKPGEALISNMMDLMPISLGEASTETRTAISEALYKLEALNPTKQPSLSPLLNGVWELRYVGGYAPDWALSSPTRELALFLYSGGYSPGVYALGLAQKLPSALVDVGDLEISISRMQPRVEANIVVKLFGGAESSVKVTARMEVESDVRLRETYESVTVLDRNVELPAALQYSRDLYVTYVDEDLLIIRDASGVPEVLVRKEKTFSRNWGTEPSDFVDMGPPGEDL